MIAKIRRGTRVQGLIRYLFGPGEHNEHMNPHIVAGFWTPPELEPALHPDGTRDFRDLDAFMTDTVKALGDLNYGKHVWHLPVRAAPEDPVLSDEQWADIAREYM
ncbi:MAG: relaxase component, partial [Massilia sp.]|nr:relaxase component [Massilia sp.]